MQQSKLNGGVRHVEKDQGFPRRTDRLLAFRLFIRRLTVFVFDAALVRAVTARLWLELDVAELQHGGHQLQHRLHLILHEAHDLHGILGGQKN